MNYDIGDFKIAVRDDGKKRLYKYTGNSSEVVIPDGVNIIGNYAFTIFGSNNNGIISECEFVRSLIIPDSVEIIEEKAFSCMEGLQKIKLPNNPNFSIIESGLFWFCKSLKTIEIPKSVKEIEGNAFAGTGLEYIDLPDSVEYIGDHVFWRCENLKYISIGKNCKKIWYNLFGNPDESGFSSKTVIFYPDNLEYTDVLKGYGEEFPNSIKKLPLSQKETYLANQNQGCYVATCVYGSYDCPPVWTLRRYRDEVLAQSQAGRLFIKVYYAVSPTAVKLFGNQQWFHKVFKGPLDRWVDKLNKEGIESAPYND